MLGDFVENVGDSVNNAIAILPRPVVKAASAAVMTAALASVFTGNSVVGQMDAVLPGDQSDNWFLNVPVVSGLMTGDGVLSKVVLAGMAYYFYQAA
uniref:Uncharacterized protein n=1 Tax=viral metagenome TaxID=1070528 RepID=A0A2V0R9K4_9ZZZZ